MPALLHVEEVEGFIFEERELSEEMNLFSMMCVSLNAKLHGVLTMMSPMKPRKKLFSTV